MCVCAKLWNWNLKKVALLVDFSFKAEKEERKKWAH